MRASETPEMASSFMTKFRAETATRPITIAPRARRHGSLQTAATASATRPEITGTRKPTPSFRETVRAR